MTAQDDPGPSRVAQVMEVYDAPDEPADDRYAGYSPRAIALVGVVAASLAVALLTGHYAVAVALLLAALAGVGIVTDRVPVPHRGEPR